jgi:NADPH:quinone reductase-like Zn-dependent oxidoreductase
VKAVVIREHGGVDKLRYEDVAEPIHSKDEVLIRVRACGVNHLDIWVRQGLPRKKISFPHICGCDIVGEVAASSSRRFAVGDKVMVYPGLSCGECQYCKDGLQNLCSKFAIIGGFSDAQGGYAEFARAPEQNLIPLPDWLSFEEAATLGVSYLTSWNMLKRTGAKENTSILVYGAGSGVGMATIQLARAMGAKVITTVGDEQKINAARSLGPVLVINRKTSDIVAEVMKFTASSGVDAVIDHVGAQTWETSLKCLRPAGRMVACGTTSGNVASVDIRSFYSRQLSIFGAHLGTRAELFVLLTFIASKKIRPVIDSTFRLGDAAKAQSKMEKSEHFGKIVLQV